MKTTILAAALLFSPLWANQPSVAPDFIADDEDYAEEAVQLDDGLFNILLEIESTMYSRQDESLFQYRLVTLLPLIMERGNPDITLPETKGNTALLDAINEALAELTADGTIQAIVDKYIPAE